MKDLCAQCGFECLTDNGLCFACKRNLFPNPYDSLVILLEAGADNISTDPRRVKDGSAEFNIGLPPVTEVVGTRKDGKPRLKSRPVSHNEVSSNRARREYAKRHGLEPAQKAFVAAKGTIR